MRTRHRVAGRSLPTGNVGPDHPSTRGAAVSATSAEQSVTLHGHAFSYADSGSGPVLLFIHGLLGSQRQWAHLVDRLDDDHRVIVPDLFGHGQSAKPMGDYSLGAHAATLRDLLDRLGIEHGDPRRPLARRWHRHGVLLPVPRARRPARARRERRARPRGEPAPAVGDAAGGGVRPPGAGLGLGAWPHRVGRPGARRRRAAPGPRRPRGVAGLHLPRRRRHPARVPRHDPRGHRPRGPERHGPRLPARG